MLFKSLQPPVRRQPMWAEVTQSAVRHYFPTKEELLLAFFTVGVERLQLVIDNKMAETFSNSKTKLLKVAAAQLDWISEIHPTWSHQECESTRFQILTLILGSWTTLGSTRPIHRHRSPNKLKAMTLEGINKLISSVQEMTKKNNKRTIGTSDPRF